MQDEKCINMQWRIIKVDLLPKMETMIKNRWVFLVTESVIILLEISKIILVKL